MTLTEFYQALQDAYSVEQVEEAIKSFEMAHMEAVQWVPVGNRENNRGTIDVSADPGRSLVERLTNGIDAVLESEFEKHNGIPDSRSPKEAAFNWLNIPLNGLHELTTQQRRILSQNVMIRMLPGEGKDSRLIEVLDRGVGLKPEQMSETILSLNANNKIQKYYLAGTYGQGGSSTFSVSKYTLIASHYNNYPAVGFTLVRYLDLPPEQYKTGHYVYLTLNNSILQIEFPSGQVPTGTLVKHFGFDLTKYPSPIGPNSVYGLLNQVLFDPIIPIWFDNQVHNWRRVIKGSRNALNGAIDEGDENKKGPTLDHNVPLFYISLGDYGRIGIEYWVLEKPNQNNKRPSAAFVNPNKPIILTLYGQNHAELPLSIIKKDAELPYLSQRLICHIDCNSLSPQAKRLLFSSTREDARRGAVYEMIEQELLKALKSDDELTRLNKEAREKDVVEKDATALQQMRKEVSRLLHLYGVSVSETTGREIKGEGPEAGKPKKPRQPKPPLEPIEINEPPTYIKIKWAGDTIEFYPGQRRYIRIETDANSNYHNPNNPSESRLNIIVSDASIKLCGSTFLQSGRMRMIFEANQAATIGSNGVIRVELMRQGLPILSDEKEFEIVVMPQVTASNQQSTVPQFEIHPVSPEDDLWMTLDWPDNTDLVASSALMDNGRLNIYYSTVFPTYKNQLSTFERRDPTIANSFTNRYEIWLAVHSLLYFQDQESSEQKDSDGAIEIAEIKERQERCRIARMAVLFASREIQLPAMVDD